MNQLIKLSIDTIRYIAYFPLMLLPLTAYLIMPHKRKQLLLEDLDAFYRVEIQRNKFSNITAFYRMMVNYNAFRNVFYYRCSHLSKLIKWTLYEDKTLKIRTSQIGGGYLYSTWHLNAD